MAGSGGDEDFGSTNPLMLAVRRRRVIAAIEQEVESGKETNPYPAFEASDAEDIDESEIDWDWDEESCAYDPTLISPEDTEWQGDFACLGLNMETNQAYISSSASHTDHTPMSPLGTDELHTYWTLDEDSVVFPIHKDCLRILHSVLGAFADLDKKTLYEAMCLLSTMFQAHLTINYGNLRGNLVDWERIPGEEYVVMRPEFSPRAKAAIREKISSGDLRRRQRLTFGIDGRNVSDPFRSLPTEILCDIASYLRLEDLKAFSMASWHAMNATRRNMFWRGVLYRETEWMGLELDNVLHGLQEEDIDYKALLLWLEKMTRPAFAVDPPWLGAANRRRIWSACKQVADTYREKKRQGIKKVL